MRGYTCYAFSFEEKVAIYLKVPTLINRVGTFCCLLVFSLLSVQPLLTVDENRYLVIFL